MRDLRLWHAVTSSVQVLVQQQARSAVLGTISTTIYRTTSSKVERTAEHAAERKPEAERASTRTVSTRTVSDSHADRSGSQTLLQRGQEGGL